MKFYLYNMKRSHKKKIVIISVILVLAVALPIIGNLIIENKISTLINSLPKHVDVVYSDINASMLSGNLELESPRIKVKGETTDSIIFSAELEQLRISDLSYWDYIFNDELSIGAINIENAIIKYSYNPLIENKNYSSNTFDKIKNSIHVETIAVTNSDVLVTNFETDSTLLSLPRFNFELSDFQTKSEPNKKQIPFTYKGFILEGENLKWSINAYENLSSQSLRITDSSAVFEAFGLKTKYTTQQLSDIINKERDHFDLTINQLTFKNLDYGFNTEDKFYLNSKRVEVDQPQAEIYRDKLVADDLTEKPLYSKMLRNLGFNLGMDEVVLENGYLKYSEKMNADSKAGTLEFKDLQASIINLGNIYGEKDTKINVKSLFMESSPMEVDWSFKVQDTADRFVFKTDLGRIQAEEMNQFTGPNLNTQFEGVLEQTYFTVNGNPYTSIVDLKVRYDDLKVIALKENGKDKKTLLSGIINLFVSNDSENKANDFRHSDTEQVERDTTKSVFNFIWLNIQDGLKSAMVGDGKREKDY
ncbi:hypothetical protein [Winogradskyella sp.]|uniref:hypothetical protein n=2 Tax=Winogradskyella sp. TaxID=1883156 RepID=UPI003514C08E